MGLSAARAAAKASSPNSCHWMGWCMAERRYEEEARERALCEAVVIRRVYRESLILIRNGLAARCRWRTSSRSDCSGAGISEAAGVDPLNQRRGKLYVPLRRYAGFVPP